MTTLHIGVNDIPYANEAPAPKKVAKARKGKANKPRKSAENAATQTTGEVAEILEAKYGVMQKFVDKHLPEIADELADGMAGALESLMMGAPPELNPFGTATAKVSRMFREFIDNKEMDGVPGVPTKASLEGRSLRFKRRRGPPRPSFQDSGLYEANATSWID